MKKLIGNVNKPPQQETAELSLMIIVSYFTVRASDNVEWTDSLVCFQIAEWGKNYYFDACFHVLGTMFED